MTIVSRKNAKNAATLAIALAVGSVVGFSSMTASSATISPPNDSQASVPNEPANDPGSKVHIDRSGKKQVGKASFYADRYSGKTMADGTPMQLYSNNAASLTLPLGTTAKVTNLETGKSAIVTIRDRGPYVSGRIIDLSPATARLIGISKKRGLASVEVTPVSFPDSHAGTRVASLR
jgi:rare lipoprotein A